MVKPRSIAPWGSIIAGASTLPSILALRKVFGCAGICVHEKSPTTPSRRPLRGRRRQLISILAQEAPGCSALPVTRKVNCLPISGHQTWNAKLFPDPLLDQRVLDDGRGEFRGVDPQ